MADSHQEAVVAADAEVEAVAEEAAAEVLESPQVVGEDSEVVAVAAGAVEEDAAVVVEVHAAE